VELLLRRRPQLAGVYVPGGQCQGAGRAPPDEMEGEDVAHMLAGLWVEDWGVAGHWSVGGGAVRPEAVPSTIFGNLIFGALGEAL